jgi:hypothetical protein
MKYAVFWDVRMLRLLVTAKVVSSSPILVTLMIEAMHSSETSVLTRATRRNIPGDDIVYNEICLSFLTKALIASKVITWVTLADMQV